MGKSENQKIRNQNSEIRKSRNRNEKFEKSDIQLSLWAFDLGVGGWVCMGGTGGGSMCMGGVSVGWVG